MAQNEQLDLALLKLSLLAKEVARSGEIADHAALISLLEQKQLSPQETQTELTRLMSEMKAIKYRMQEFILDPIEQQAEVLALQAKGKLYGNWFRVIRMQQGASEEG